ALTWTIDSRVTATPVSPSKGEVLSIPVRGISSRRKNWATLRGWILTTKFVPSDTGGASASDQLGAPEREAVRCKRRSELAVRELICSSELDMARTERTGCALDMMSPLNNKQNSQ